MSENKMVPMDELGETAVGTGQAPRSSQTGFGFLVRRVIASEYLVLYLSIALFLIFWPIVPTIATPQNLENLLSNTWPLLAIAIGQTFVMIIAGIDLSQISIIAVTSVLGAALITSAANPVLFEQSVIWGVLLTEQGGPLAGSAWAVPVAIAAMLLLGAFLGWLNGVAIARFNIPAFMMTLVTMMFFGSFAVMLTRAENITGLPVAFNALGRDSVAGFALYPLLISGGLAVLAHLLLSRSILGRWLYATGINPRAARISGVPVRFVITIAFVLSGVYATVGSILYSARLGMGRPGFGESLDLLLDVVGAVVIGGTSLFGGRGKVVWTLFGVILFVLLTNILNLLNLSYFTVNIVKGVVILLAALLDMWRQRLLAAA